MIVMPANNTGIRIGYLAGRYPGRIGHLLSPGAQCGPFDFIPYALDNGAFSQGDNWSEEKWFKLADWARISAISPRWALVPDVVANRNETLAKWDKYSSPLALYGWPLAFAVQDGMTPSDVPSNAEVVFVGGSTEWKWETLEMWCSAFPRVHVGRVNTYKRAWQCHDAGAESIDGTGWMRGDQRQWRDLLHYLAESSGEKRRPSQLVLGAA